MPLKYVYEAVNKLARRRLTKSGPSASIDLQHPVLAKASAGLLFEGKI